VGLVVMAMTIAEVDSVPLPILPESNFSKAKHHLQSSQLMIPIKMVC